MRPVQAWPRITEKESKEFAINFPRYISNCKGSLSFGIMNCARIIRDLKTAKPIYCDEFGMPSPIGYSGNLLLQACIVHNVHVDMLPIPSISAIVAAGGSFKQRPDGSMMVTRSTKRAK